MIYILDAYNVIHKIKSLETALDKDLRSSREALVNLCRNLLQTRGGITKIILVFDGRSEFRGLSHPSPPRVEMVFSETGEEADEKIVEVLESLGKNTRKCVVSDDNFVRNQARAYQTQTVTVAEFELLSRPRTAKNNPSSAPKSSSLSQAAADKITAEYKKQLGL